MYGSIFYNLWGALLAFTVAFLLQVFNTIVAAPLPTILWSLLWASIGFLAMYFIRLLVGYIIFTPEEIILEEEDVQQEAPIQATGTLNGAPDVMEFEEENTEEVAQVIRTMLNKD